ncbi:hypothetical protein EX30DRAFT_121373 [Ascodesmis nigricans]|uniref:Uncharacterized protein n=1 Tax=Ascodesmis nigricans TaxID=341454 RepID=A0A4S2MPD2_9PEZI|nr:hypothetical protein EX30DRAFT_121373 [Ascodesmis nigricans]
MAESGGELFLEKGLKEPGNFEKLNESYESSISIDRRRPKSCLTSCGLRSSNSRLIVCSAIGRNITASDSPRRAEPMLTVDWCGKVVTNSGRGRSMRQPPPHRCSCIAISVTCLPSPPHQCFLVCLCLSPVCRVSNPSLRSLPSS